MTDTAFAVHPSPVGDILLVLSDAGLVVAQVLRGDGEDGDLYAQLGRLTRTLRSVPQRTDDTDGATAQIDEYFAGTRRSFDVPLDWRLVEGFARDALQTVCEVPYAQTAGYGEIAALAGRPRAARAVGNACARSPFSIVVPVHRVVHADGSIGGYGGRADVKRFLLDREREHARAAGE